MNDTIGTTLIQSQYINTTNFFDDHVPQLIINYVQV